NRLNDLGLFLCPTWCSNFRVHPGNFAVTTAVTQCGAVTTGRDRGIRSSRSGRNERTQLIQVMCPKERQAALLRLPQVQQFEHAGKSCGWNYLLRAELSEPVFSLDCCVVVQPFHAVRGAIRYLALDGHKSGVMESYNHVRFSLSEFARGAQLHRVRASDDGVDRHRRHLCEAQNAKVDL